MRCVRNLDGWSRDRGASPAWGQDWPTGETKLHDCSLNCLINYSGCTKITFRCVSPDNWKANGLHWLYLGWFFILSKLFDLTQIEHETFAFPFSQLDFKSWQVWGETDRIQKLPVWGFTSRVSPIPSLEKDEHLGWNLSLRQSATTSMDLIFQVTRLGSDGDDLCLKHLTFVFEVKNYLQDKLKDCKENYKKITLQNKSRNLFSCFLLWGWVSVYLEKKRQLHLEKYERVRDRRLWEGAVSNADSGWTSWKIQIRRYLDLGHQYLYLI